MKMYIVNGKHCAYKDDFANIGEVLLTEEGTAEYDTYCSADNIEVPEVLNCGSKEVLPENECFEVDKDGDKYYIRDYKCNVNNIWGLSEYDHIIIPSTIDTEKYGTVEIDYIDTNAFNIGSNARSNLIKCANISEGIKKIRMGAFGSSYSYATPGEYPLEKVIFPSSLEVLELASFSGTSLKYIDLSMTNNLEIGEAAFANNLITDYKFPVNYTAEFGILNNNHVAKADKLFILDKEDSSKVISYAGLNKNPIISNNITKIGLAAFSTCGLESIILHDDVELIEAGAFNLNKLFSFKIPKKVSELYIQTFMSNNIREITLPKTLSRFADFDFVGVEIYPPYEVFENNPLEIINIEGDCNRFNENFEDVFGASKSSFIINCLG